MSSASQTALFASLVTDSPIVFPVKSNPRTAVKHQLTFIFNAGQISFSKGVFDLLGVDSDNRYMTFVNYRGNAYITRSDNTDHFWLNLRSKDSGVYSGYICKKQFVQASMRELDYGVDAEVSFPVAPHQVHASELNLDPEQFPYPLYRIVADSKVNLGA